MLDAARRPAVLGVAALTGVLAVIGAAPAAQAASPDSVLTVVHGVRGLVADVRLDGKLVLSGFAPERVTDPLTLPAGKHRVQAWPSGTGQKGAPVVDAVIDLPAGGRSTAGIGIDADGKAFLKLFDDRPLLPRANSTALAVRGLAQADGVSVTADDETLADSLDPAEEEFSAVGAGRYEVRAVDASDSSRLVPPQDVPVGAGRAVVLYLIGSEEDDTLGWVAQTVRPSDAAPRRVDSGVGPLPERSPQLPTGLPLAALLLPAGGLLAAAAAARARRARA